MKLIRLFVCSIFALFIITNYANAGHHSKTGNIVQTAKKAGKFNTLLVAAKKAGLVRALSKKHPITVFAPTDHAFSKLPAGTVEELIKPKNRHKLRKILLYHVVKGRIYAKDIPHKPIYVKTLSGKKLKVRRGLFSVKINNARVRAADVKASNGVIHVINRVLLP